MNEPELITAKRLYYLLPHVQKRIMEFCGCSGNDGDCTARFLIGDGQTVLGPGILERADIRDPTQIREILDRGVDIFRSLWDRDTLLASLDLDYSNLDFADEAFYHPEASFEKLEPVYNCISQFLKSFGIDHIVVMTGQGYHFSWRIAEDSSVHKRFEELASLPPSLQAKYEYDHPLTPETLPLRKGKAHSGLGLLMEYLTFEIIKGCSSFVSIPLVFTGLTVGSAMVGRESISLDLSAYGDPLYMRYVRCAFSLYHKFSIKSPLGALVCLPRCNEFLGEMLEKRKNLLASGNMAQVNQAVIPDSTSGTARLLEEYLSSPLRKNHLYFQEGWHDDPKDWGKLYDRLDLSLFSPCVSRPLYYPNDALLKPANIQNVTRVLIGMGWHPRSVAGLIRSKYERDFKWGVNWTLYDAANRADFYVRNFYALAASGVDDLRDFNCISHQEKGYCPQPFCGHNLADYRERLKKALS